MAKGFEKITYATKGGAGKKGVVTKAMPKGGQPMKSSPKTNTQVYAKGK